MGLTLPLTVAESDPVEKAFHVYAVGRPAVKVTWFPWPVPTSFVATSAAQYCVPPLRPVIPAVTKCPPGVVLLSATGEPEVVCAGDPELPPLVHQVEAAAS